MNGTRLRDFFLGVIAACLLLITARVHDPALSRRADAQEPERPTRVSIVDAAPLRVELVRRLGANQYARFFDEKGDPVGALPVQLTARADDRLVPVRAEFDGRLSVRTTGE